MTTDTSTEAVERLANWQDDFGDPGVAKFIRALAAERDELTIENERMKEAPLDGQMFTDVSQLLEQGDKAHAAMCRALNMKSTLVGDLTAALRLSTTCPSTSPWKLWRADNGSADYANIICEAVDCIVAVNVAQHSARAIVAAHNGEIEEARDG